jgi:hypothetical protein
MPVGKRSGLEEMVRDLPSAFVDGTGIDHLDRVRDARVQLPREPERSEES